VISARFLPSARREFLAAVEYYSGQRPGLGARFIEAVEHATARALAFPLAGAETTSRTRKVYLRGFPFYVVYEPVNDGIVVVAIAHHARMPGYWQSRVQEDWQSTPYQPIYTAA
jgi:plasmid stabilization system protein ParE